MMWGCAVDTKTIRAWGLALALALASVGACKAKPQAEDADDVPKPAELATTNGEATATEEGDAVDRGELDDPRAAALTIARATSAATIAGRGEKSLGFRIDKISHLFALAATAKLPDWGAPGEGEAKLARDDDLDTAWRCEFGGAKPCVLGFALPEQAKVEVLRLYAAAGPRYRDYSGHPRVAKVRVHSEAGYVDASVADGANHGYVRFDAPIDTQFIAVEVLEVHGGKRSDGLVHLAEVEIFGTDGIPRQPIELDPSLAWASWETTSWSGAGDHTIRHVFINFASAGLIERRLLRATAVFGQAGDDYLLFERLHGTDCVEHRGSYLLYDKRNRMIYPLGDLGGAGANVYRHTNGRGFAVGWIGDGQFTVKGMVEEGGELKWKRPPKQAPADGEALLREWGFETKAQPRGVALEGAVPGCHRAALGELEPLVSAANLKDAAKQDPAAWIVCSVGANTLYATASCGAAAQAYQLSGDKLVGKHVGKHDDARGLRLRRVGDRLLVELSATGGDTSTLLWAEPDSLRELASNGGLFVRPPAACSACGDEWVNPAGPVYASDEEGDEGDDGGDEDDEDEDLEDDDSPSTAP